MSHLTGGLKKFRIVERIKGFYQLPPAPPPPKLPPPKPPNRRLRLRRRPSHLRHRHRWETTICLGRQLRYPRRLIKEPPPPPRLIRETIIKIMRKTMIIPADQPPVPFLSPVAHSRPELYTHPAAAWISASTPKSIPQ